MIEIKSREEAKATLKDLLDGCNPVELREMVHTILFLVLNKIGEIIKAEESEVDDHK